MTFESSGAQFRREFLPGMLFTAAAFDALEELDVARRIRNLAEAFASDDPTPAQICLCRRVQTGENVWIAPAPPRAVD